MNDTSPKRFSSSYRATLVQSSLPSLAGNADLQRLLLQKQLNEERLLRQLAYKQQTLQLFQSQKNLKMDQYQLQVEQQILKLKRKFQADIDNLSRKLMETERQLREVLGSQHDLQLINNNLMSEIQGLDKDRLRGKQQIRVLNDHINKLTDALKQSQLQQIQLRQKNADMQQQIMVLLQIQGDKSKQIIILSQTQKNLHNKLISLQDIINQLQLHVKSVNQKLRHKDSDCEQLKFIVGKMDSEIQNKDLVIINLQKEIEEAVRRQKIREAEVAELMKQSQRLYGELTREKHKIKDLAIQYKFAVF